jgi:histidinol-phosphatase (PHP family)
MAETGLFDLVGHADLPKKFGFAPAVGLDEEIGAALDAIARNGLTVELNTSGWNKPCEEAYPAQGILTSCARRGIPILVTADAHRDAELTQHFDRALAVLNRLGVAPVSQWSGKGR